MQPASAESQNLRAYFSGLGENGYAIILVVDGGLPEPVLQEFLPLCHTVILDGGAGFAAYGQATTHLLREPAVAEIDQLLYGDDSVFVRPSALRPLLQTLRDRKDEYLGIGETFHRRYHLPGWFFAVPRRVVLADAFTAFWHDAAPLGRGAAPVAGDIALSEAILRSGETPHPLFDANGMLAQLRAMGRHAALDLLLRFSSRAQYAALFSGLATLPGDPADLVTMAAVERLLLDGFVQEEPLARFNLLLLKCCGFPFLRKDLVYRDAFDCLQIDAAVSDWVGADATHRPEIARAYRLRDPLKWRRNVLSGTP